MKTLQLKTLPLLLVELPEGYRITGIDGYTDGQRYLILYSDTEPEQYKKLPDGEWDMIGKLSEIPDEWFENLVDYYVYEDTTYGERRAFRDYVTGEDTDDYWDMYPYDNARESFYSLLEAKERVHLNGNPMGDKEPDPLLYNVGHWSGNAVGYSIHYKNWQQAQSRTLDPERTYIFTVKTEEK